MKLRLMMFLQYLLFAVWWVPMAAFLTDISIEGIQKTLILSSMAIGAMASPIVCAIADRYFSAQKILCVTNLFTALMVILASFLTSSPNLLFLTIFLAMISYMPSWSLVSAIALAHSRPESFPRIRLFGTLGWVASGVFSFVAINVFDVAKFDGTSVPLVVGGVIAVIAAIQNLTLPDTPPNPTSEKLSVKSMLGFGAISMMKDKNYAIFIIFSFLATIPFALYMSFGSQFLQYSKFEFITITMNWGQVAEVLFLFFTTTLIAKLGLKKSMVLGLVMLSFRYLSFVIGLESSGEFFYFIAILLHGSIFGLFYIAGQIYTERVASKTLKAQAQGFLSFVVWGLGMLAGILLSGVYIDLNTTIVEGVQKTDWSIIFTTATIISVVLTVLFAFMFKYKKGVAN